MYVYACVKMDDEGVDWDVIKPHVFATIMDFFASGLPVVSEEPVSGDTGEMYVCMYVCTYVCLFAYVTQQAVSLIGNNTRVV